MKKIFPLLLLSISAIFIFSDVFAQTVYTNNTKTVIETGVGLGSVIAVVASWSRNQSILWAILHGILSWLYVIYFALTRNEN